MAREMSRLQSKLEELTEELAAEVRKILMQLGYFTVRVEVPPLSSERSIDLLAWKEGNESEKVHLKVTLDVEMLSHHELSDLVGFSGVLESTPIVVSEYSGKLDLADEVVYEKNRIPAVNINTLALLLQRSRSLYVLYKKGNYHIRIDGKKLREKREERGMSIGEVANILGVSRKTVYEYEREGFDVTLEVAEKLVDLFGEEITRPYIPSKRLDETPLAVGRERPDNRLEKKIIEMAGSEYMVYHAKRTFIDILFRRGKRKVAISVEHPRSPWRVEEKIAELSKLERMKDVYKVAVVKDERKLDLKAKNVMVLDERRVGDLMLLLKAENGKC